MIQNYANFGLRGWCLLLSLSASWYKRYMSVLVIRHGLSAANDRNNIGTLAFGAKDAPLMELGREQARRRAATLPADYGIIPQTTSVAVSELARTQETAGVMGFQSAHMTPYASLNEVSHGMEGAALRALLNRGALPPAALQAAEIILHQPPAEAVWVTHGLVIAGLSQTLGVSHQFERLIPRFCEVRELDINATP
jgi:broad specificity phosphatase PhoE